MFLAHFEHGFGLPASNFFWGFLDFFSLQPHHLPANAIVSPSSFTSFTEGYFGLWPTTEAWSKYFHLRKQTISGSDPKVMTACSSVSITPRTGSIFPWITGLDTCKKWQKSFLYVKSAKGHDALNLLEFRIEPPTTELNFRYYPAGTFSEIQIMHEALEDLLEKNLCTDDLLWVFVCRQVSPLQRRVHKICHMSGLLDPTRISKHDLTRASIKRRVNAIAYTEMSDKWRWGVEPFH